MTELTTPRNEEEGRMEFTVETLETPALTKAQLAEMLFEQIALFEFALCRVHPLA